MAGHRKTNWAVRRGAAVLAALLLGGAADAQSILVPLTGFASGFEVSGPPASLAPASETKPLAPALRPPPAASAGEVSPREGRGWILRTGLSLGAVLALAAGAGWVLRAVAKKNGGLRASLGAGGRAPAGILEIIGRYPLGRGASLVLLKLDRRVLLLAQSSGGRFGGGGFSTLCEITDPEEVASVLVKARDADGDSMAERFRSMLSRYDRDMAATEDDTPSGRRAAGVSGGDTAEVWDSAGGSIPIVDLTRQPGPSDPSGAMSLRRRLAALKRTGEGA